MRMYNINIIYHTLYQIKNIILYNSTIIIFNNDMSNNKIFIHKIFNNKTFDNIRI